MFSDAVRKVNHKVCNSIIMGTSMEVTAKTISLLLMVFTLSTEANHGGEYFITLKTEFPPSILSIVMSIH